MSSVDVSQVPALVAQDAYPAAFAAYEAADRVYQSICEVLPTDGSIYGTKGSVISTLGDPMEVADGEEIPADTFEAAYTWQCAIKRYGRRLDIPKRLMEASDAQGKIASMLAEFGRMSGERHAQFKDAFIAGKLQKGTLTAGSRKYFDNSFVGETDPNPTVGYDGLPWFDTAHTIASGTSTFVNHTVSRALTAANLQTTLTTMRDTNAVDDRELKVSIRPNTLIVPPNLEYTARTILESASLPGSANNDTNVVRGALDLIVMRELTDDTDAWWTAERMKGLRCYDSGAPMLETQYDAVKQVMHVTAVTFFGAVVTDWRHWYCCNKAAS